MQNQIDIILRNEQPKDYRIVEELTREAFWNHHVPGCDEHYLLHTMRNANSFIKELDMVAEVGRKIVGNIVYTKAAIIDDDDKSHEVILFGPLSVLPEFQGRGIGGALIESTKIKAKELGYKAILIYGDPEYYSRFGFVAAETFKIGTPENMYALPLQALELVPDALSKIEGRLFEDQVYNVDETASKEFDKSFSPKELRDDLLSQKRYQYLVSMKRPRK